MDLNKLLKKLPSSSGIYEYYQNNSILYIGKTVNIRKRTIQHYENYRISKPYVEYLKNIDKITDKNKKIVIFCSGVIQSVLRIELVFDRITDVKYQFVPKNELYRKESRKIKYKKPIFNKETTFYNDEIDVIRNKARRFCLQTAKEFWDELEEN